jgi:hypothetical protein
MQRAMVWRLMSHKESEAEWNNINFQCPQVVSLSTVESRGNKRPTLW